MNRQGAKSTFLSIFRQEGSLILLDRLDRGPFDHCLVKLCLALVCGIATTVPAATITVTSTADSGGGSLRAALASAGNGDTINFSLTTPATITLTTGLLQITNSLTILGPGAGNLAINGNANDHVFSITPSNTVTLAGLTITNGLIANPGNGGGVLNYHSTLTVSNCTISGNFSGGHGGAIANDGYGVGPATLTVVNSTLRGDSSGYGGGISNDGHSFGSATLTLVNSSLNGGLNRSFMLSAWGSRSSSSGGRRLARPSLRPNR